MFALKSSCWSAHGCLTAWACIIYVELQTAAFIPVMRYQSSIISRWRICPIFVPSIMTLLKNYIKWLNMNWLEVSLTVNGELAEAVADVLARFAYSGVMMEQGVKYTDDEDAGTPTGPITVRAYLEMNDQIKETRQKLEESLYYLGMIQALPAASYKQIADQNWMEAWKQHYKPILVGERLIIVPAWMDSPDPNRIPIKINPGMAFGT